MIKYPDICNIISKSSMILHHFYQFKYFERIYFFISRKSIQCALQSKEHDKRWHASIRNTKKFYCFQCCAEILLVINDFEISNEGSNHFPGLKTYDLCITLCFFFIGSYWQNYRLRNSYLATKKSYTKVQPSNRQCISMDSKTQLFEKYW